MVREHAVRAIRAEGDARRKLQLYAAAMVGIQPRLAPLIRVLQAALVPELKEFWQSIAQRRASNMQLFVKDLAATGRLDAGLSEPKAADIIWSMNSPEFYLLLMRERRVFMRPMSELAEIFGKLGVSNDSHVVLYMSKNWITAATRVYLTLEAMGLGPHVSILDGGLPAWKKENRPVTAEMSAPKPATIQTCPQSDVITDLDYVKQNLHKPGVSILDSRLEQHWSGRETPKGSRTGHIPGANTLPFERLYDDTGKMRTAAEAESILTAAGVKKTDRVVVYCYIGQRATGLYFVLRYLGYDARLFDGSWEEWNQHTELPVEVSAAK